MPSRHLACLLAFLELSGAYVQLDFQKQRVPLSQIHPTIRERHLLRKRAEVVGVTLDNAQNNLLYLVNVTVGSNDQKMALQLDTGSSDIWIPYVDSEICQSSEQPCINGAFEPDTSTTYSDIAPEKFAIQYVDGTEISGDYITDTFSFGGASITKQIMGLAKDAHGQSDSVPFQGIMGVGFPSGESWVAMGGEQYPNIISTLKSQKHINTMLYSLWLNDLEASTGTVLFGGVDESKYAGNLTILPIQPDADSGGLTSFTVVLDSFNIAAGDGKVQYNQSSLAMPVILDSGTTLTYLPDQIAQAIANGVGAERDPNGGLWVPCNLTSSPATFNFMFGNANGPKIQVQISEFVIPYPPQPDGQPPSLADGTPMCQWGISNSGDAPNLFGDTFLRSAYVVYDIQNNNIAIAQTKFNVSSSDSNIQDITNSNLPGVSSTATGVEVTQTFKGNPNKPTGGNAETMTLNNEGATFSLFEVSETTTAAAATGSGSSTSRGAAAGTPVSPTTTFVSVVTLTVMVFSGLSGAFMVLL